MISLKPKNSEGGDNRAIATHNGKIIYLNTLQNDNFELWVDLKKAIKEILFEDTEFLKMIEKVDISLVEKLKQKLYKMRSEIAPSGSDEEEVVINRKTRTKTIDNKVEILYEKSKKILERIYGKEYMSFDDNNLEPILNMEEAAVYAYFSPSGSGKSWKVNQLLEQIQAKEPKTKFFLFSKVSDDYPKIKNMIRIPTSGEEAMEVLGMDKKTKERKLKIDDLANSVVVFDDIGTIANKEINASVQLLQDEVLEVYRHHNITPFFTQHVLAAGLKAQKLINEVTHMTLYPNSNWDNIRKYLEKNGIGRALQRRIQETGKKSRSFTMYKNAPQLILYDKGIIII